MKKLFIVFVLISYLARSQNVQSSNTYIQTCYHSQNCFSLNSSSFIFYDPENHELMITVDFSKFKVGVDTLDAWLDDLDDTKLIFRGILKTDDLLELTHNNSNVTLVNGTINFNGVSHPHSIELTLFEISREGMLYKDNQQDYYDRINANLQLGFYPKEFNVHKKAHQLRKKITIAIYKGHINMFKPEMEHWIKN